MCGIAGSFSIPKAFELYKENLKRGVYSSSVTAIWDAKQTLARTKAPPLTFKREGVFENFDSVLSEGYYLAHSRAPTSGVKAFVPEDNHPFVWGDWVVAHNGIISNAVQLGEKYFATDYTNLTDSSIIPRLLELHYSDLYSEYKMTPEVGISNTLRLLQGTHCLWMYNTAINRLYISRCANTLFFHPNGNFSSSDFEGSAMVPEGEIFEINITGTEKFPISKAGKFKTESPYFIF